MLNSVWKEGVTPRPLSINFQHLTTLFTTLNGRNSEEKHIVQESRDTNQPQGKNWALLTDVWLHLQHIYSQCTECEKKTLSNIRNVDNIHIKHESQL